MQNPFCGAEGSLHYTASTKRKKNRQPQGLSCVEVFAEGEDAHVLRLESKLLDLQTEHAHTACGILPSEEKKLKSSSESAIRRNRIPSGNTPFCFAE